VEFHANFSCFFVYIVYKNKQTRGVAMTIPFATFFQRLRDAVGIRTQTELAKALGVDRSAVTQAKLRDAVPQKCVLALARRYTLSPDWLEYGAPNARSVPPASRHGKGAVSAAGRETSREAMPFAPPPQWFAQAERPAAPGLRQKMPAGAVLAPLRPSASDVVYVPKVRARLCAGGGSFVVEAVPVAEHPFPRQWLARMGSPASMVFMDVIGDSMAPSIADGDMVLVDQSGVRLTPHAVYAVGVEDGIFIKRVEQRDGAIILHSDNPAYSDMELYGDELETFRVIGKVVWLCRDLRQ
jgi:phage repressor protein C with HTH and peptisase S24 domain